ncbi:MAG TPA: dihydroneopterin aldolase [Gaiellaceae bacterium]|nr:dihydroneopterin aldolase [Gaiellaceae bacterium]
MIHVEIHGLEVFGHHGVTEDERARGQIFLFDVELDVDDRALSDRLEDTVDYVEVARCVEDVSESNRFALLEALAAAAADAIVARFEVTRVRLRVRKPEIKAAGLAAEWTAATVEWTR